MKCTICEENESTYWLKKLRQLTKKEALAGVSDVVTKDPICQDCKMGLENEIMQGMKLPFEFELIEKVKVKRLQK